MESMMFCDDSAFSWVTTCAEIGEGTGEETIADWYQKRYLSIDRKISLSYNRSCQKPDPMQAVHPFIITPH